MDAFVVADAHGNLDAVAGLLRQAGIVDDAWERVDRETLVVQVGDLCNCVAESLVDDHRCLDHVEKWFDAYLVGNHEHPYFGGPSFSGWWRDPVLERRLALLDAKGFLQPCVAADGVLVSHAGVTQGANFLAVGGGAASAEEYAAAARDLWRTDKRHYVFSMIGRSRGGWDAEGGILWSDWDEPKSPAFSQVMGHSVGTEIRWRRSGEWFAVCIDLGAKDPRRGRIAGAWVRDGEVEVVVYDVAELEAA